MNISYDYYRIFYEVGRYKSFSKAAKVLNNSQPNISRAMNNLEHEVHCKLFVRSNRGIRLTPEGERLFFYVEGAVRQLEIAEAEMDTERIPQQVISIGVSIGITDAVLREKIIPILHDFRELYPMLAIHIVNDSTPELLKKVQERQIDLALITAYEKNEGQINETVLYSFQDILVTGTKGRELCEKKLSLRRLQDYPIVGLWKETETYAFYKDFFAYHGLPYELSVETMTSNQVLAFVAYDMGVGFVSPEYARDAIEEGKVFRIDLEEKIPMRYITLIYKIDKPVSVDIEILEDMLVKGFRSAE